MKTITIIVVLAIAAIASTATARKLDCGPRMSRLDTERCAQAQLQRERERAANRQKEKHEDSIGGFKTVNGRTLYIMSYDYAVDTQTGEAYIRMDDGHVNTETGAVLWD